MPCYDSRDGYSAQLTTKKARLTGRVACWYMGRFGIPKDAPNFVKFWAEEHKAIDKAIAEGHSPSSEIPTRLDKMLKE